VPEPLARLNLKVTSGSLANEGALKAAYKKRGTTEVVALRGSHHGQSIATMRISGKNFDKTYVDRTGVTFFQPCSSGLEGCDRCVRRNSCERADEIYAFLDRHHSRLAAVILEPVMVDAGVLIASRLFLAQLRERTARYGIALIFDEVQTGFGWTGRLFACEHVGVTPDLLTVCKGFAAGLPLAAILMSQEYDVLDYGEHEITHCARTSLQDSGMQELVSRDPITTGVTFFRSSWISGWS
jgi:4-aminobutyrate aminotransferase-like enzyme